jgi:hypothetical protein
MRPHQPRGRHYSPWPADRLHRAFRACTHEHISLRLDVKLSPQILQTDRWLCHLTAASRVVESMMCSRAPLLDRHYPVSTLIRTQPPPSRLRPISRGNRLYGLPCSSHFCLGRGRLLQLLSMPLSPCCPYHPAGGMRLNSQSATHPAAFARPQRVRPPGLFCRGHPWVHLRYGPVTRSPS